MRSMLTRCLLLAAFAAGSAHAVDPCGDLERQQGLGPYDYRTASQKTRELVEHYHFTESVETLTKGASSVVLGEDISYTLRVFPNHPRALLAMAELARRQKIDPPKGSAYTVACWFDRAIRFRPDDGQVHLAYGIALLRNGERQAAIAQLQKADELLPNDANVHYNLGLAYFDLRDYDQALTHAKKAYALGFPLPGLRQMLERANQWH